MVRGGMVRDPAVLLSQLQDLIDQGKPPAVSLRWREREPDESDEMYLLRVCTEGRIKHGKIQLSLRSTLEANGFELVLDRPGGDPLHHCDVLFDQPLTLERARAFIASFSEPIPRPREQP